MSTTDAKRESLSSLLDFWFDFRTMALRQQLDDLSKDLKIKASDAAMWGFPDKANSYKDCAERLDQLSGVLE